MLDGCQGEHPAGMDWQLTNLHALVGPPRHARLDILEGSISKMLTFENETYSKESQIYPGDLTNHEEDDD